MGMRPPRPALHPARGPVGCASRRGLWGAAPTRCVAGVSPVAWGQGRARAGATPASGRHLGRFSPGRGPREYTSTKTPHRGAAGPGQALPRAAPACSSSAAPGFPGKRRPEGRRSWGEPDRSRGKRDGPTSPGGCSARLQGKHAFRTLRGSRKKRLRDTKNPLGAGGGGPARG